jgi:acyl-CoA synthetase (AMP-forming)/AMP-acid ligase II
MRSGELTGCFLVPTMIDRLLAHPDVHGGDYGTITSIIYGGAPMSPGLLRRAMDTFGCGFINAFGAATEGGLQSVLSSADHRRALAGAEHLLGSIGRPAYGVDLRICDPDGVEVPRGTVGEIVTRSDAVMAGYLGMPDETARAIRDGWFWGGDLGRIDDEGYLHLEGRRTDMIIRGGENVYPVEIETVLSDHPSVSQVAVIGRPDGHWGEVVVAYVVAAPGHAIDAEELRAHCRTSLAAFKVPVAVEVVDAMPLNASGKILKRELRALDVAAPAGEGA